MGTTLLAGTFPPANTPSNADAPSANGNGTKKDQGKLRYDLIPPEALKQLAAVLTVGANKYSARNWEQGIAFGRVFAAMMRHLWCWWAGYDADEEDGLPHLSHALCNLVFLVAYTQRPGYYSEYDDRPAGHPL